MEIIRKYFLAFYLNSGFVSEIVIYVLLLHVRILKCIIKEIVGQHFFLMRINPDILRKRTPRVTYFLWDNLCGTLHVSVNHLSICGQTGSSWMVFRLYEFFHVSLEYLSKSSCSHTGSSWMVSHQCEFLNVSLNGLSMSSRSHNGNSWVVFYWYGFLHESSYHLMLICSHIGSSWMVYHQYRACVGDDCNLCSSCFCLPHGSLLFLPSGDFSFLPINLNLLFHFFILHFNQFYFSKHYEKSRHLRN